MCCGVQRQKYQTPKTPRQILPVASARGGFQASNVKFEYFGRTGVTVRGRMSGRTYRFDRPGFQVEVDSRDASSLKGIPNLRQVASARVDEFLLARRGRARCLARNSSAQRRGWPRRLSGPHPAQCGEWPLGSAVGLLLLSQPVDRGSVRTAARTMLARAIAPVARVISRSNSSGTSHHTDESGGVGFLRWTRGEARYMR